MPPATALLGDARVARWQRLTLQANLAMEERQDIRARQLYEEALSVAEALLNDAALPEAALPEAALSGAPDAASLAPLLHGSSCNSIVELARLQGDLETASIYMYRRVASLLWVIEAPDAPLALRSRCLLHLKVASGGLYEYFEQGGMWDAAAEFSERTNAAMFDVQRLEADASSAHARLERSLAR